MPKPIFNGCCACTEAVSASEKAMNPPESHLASLFILVSSL